MPCTRAARTRRAFHPGVFEKLAGFAHLRGATSRRPPPAPSAAQALLRVWLSRVVHGLGCIVIFMCLIGWYFIFLLIKDRKKLAAGNKILLPDPPVNELYLTLGLFFGIGGFSQALPYFFTFDTASSTGGYSKAIFSPGITECLAAWSWLGFGIFFLVKAIMGMKGTAAVSPATYEK